MKPMARVVELSIVVSLDGYINGPGGEFIPPDWSADMDAWTDAMPALYDTMLFGRAAWQQLAAYWPAAEADPDMPEPARRMARFMNATRKIVFSRTLTDLSGWANSEPAGADIASVAARERARPGDGSGRGVVIFAGARFAQTALAAGAVDRLSILTIPQLFGHGTRLFEGHALRRRLKLTECRALDTGAVLTRYGIVPP